MPQRILLSIVLSLTLASLGCVSGSDTDESGRTIYMERVPPNETEDAPTPIHLSQNVLATLPSPFAKAVRTAAHEGEAEARLVPTEYDALYDSLREVATEQNTTVTSRYSYEGVVIVTWELRHG